MIKLRNTYNTKDTRYFAAVMVVDDLTPVLDQVAEFQESLGYPVQGYGLYALKEEYNRPLDSFFLGDEIELTWQCQMSCD